MTLEFRDHQILVVSPGSSLTQAQMGLSESLMPPAFEVPTLVYETPLKKLTLKADPSHTEIRPLVSGKIANMEAFLFFLKVLYRSVTPVDGLPPAVYLVASLQWSRRQLEQITRYLFEEVGIPGLAVGLQGVITAYAFNTADALVIDVGLSKTEVTAVVSLEAKREASRVLDEGGDSINAALAAKLPQFTADQIEDLKRSEIYEVVGADHRHNSDDFPVEAEDGVVDVAAIVASGRAREILNKREQQRVSGKSDQTTNQDMETNTFVDRHGEQITVGLERFVGTEALVAAVVDSVADVLFHLEPREQQRIFDNVVLTGHGCSVRGLSELIAEKLDSRYVIRPPRNAAASIARNGAAAATQIDENAPTQSPTSISFSQFPSHFPEWKTRKWDDYMFVGAQIGAKQVLTTGVEGLFVGRQDYTEMGPSCVWDTFN